MRNNSGLTRRRLILTGGGLATMGMSGCLNFTEEGNTTTSEPNQGTPTQSAEYPLSLEPLWEIDGILDRRDVSTDGNMLYLSSPQVSAVDLQSGETQWHATDIESDVASIRSVYVGNRFLYRARRVQNDDDTVTESTLSAFEKESGERQWHFKDPESLKFSQFEQSSNYVAWEKSEDHNSESTLYILSKETGDIEQTLTRTISDFFLTDDYLFLTYNHDDGVLTDVYSLTNREEVDTLDNGYNEFRDGWFYGYDSRFNRETGTRVWWELPSGSRSNFTLFGNRLTEAVNGKQFIINTASGTIEASVQLAARPASPAAPTESRFWVIDGIGNLYAISWDGEIRYKRPIISSGTYIPRGLAATDNHIIFTDIQSGIESGKIICAKITA